jgi:hypothetical protein
MKATRRVWTPQMPDNAGGLQLTYATHVLSARIHCSRHRYAWSERKNLAFTKASANTSVADAASSSGADGRGLVGAASIRLSSSG